MSKLLLAENSSAPDTPPAGTVALYAKDDAKLYRKDDTGAETELGAGGSGSTATPQNALINGSFAIWQRGVTQTGVGDDSYAPDRWVVLTESGAVGAARIDGDSQRYAARLTQSNATAQRFGVAQIIEGANCQHLRGQVVSVAARVRCSAASAVSIAVLEWSGTEDVVTSDVVATWGSTPTWAASVTSPGSAGSATCTSPTTWYDLKQENVTFGSSFTNLVVVVWTEGQRAQDVTLDIEAAQLVDGASAGTFQPRSVGEELALCQRYFQKSYDLDQEPGSTSPDNALLFSLPVSGSGHLRAPIVWQMPMRIAPTVTVYDSNGTKDRISQVNGTVWTHNIAGTTILSSETRCIFYTDGSSTKSGMKWNYTAKAEL